LLEAAHSMIVEHLYVGPLQCACTLAVDEETREAVVVDPGDEPDRILGRLAQHHARLTHILVTHAHLDHVAGYAALRATTGAAGALHPSDLPLYARLANQARYLGMAEPATAPFDAELKDGETRWLGTMTVETIFTPGHTLGSCCFALRDGDRTMLLTGDTLFAGSIGRWDVGGISQVAVVESIQTRLLPYADATPVVPGHGPQTTIGRERAENPYLRAP